MTLLSWKLFVGTASKRSFLLMGIMFLFHCPACVLFAQAPQPQSPLPPPSGKMMEMDNHLHGVFYSVKEGWKSTLVLNNVIGSTSRAKITLYNKHGQALSVPEITLNPHESRYFSVSVAKQPHTAAHSIPSYHPMGKMHPKRAPLLTDGGPGEDPMTFIGDRVRYQHGS